MARFVCIAVFTTVAFSGGGTDDPKEITPGPDTVSTDMHGTSFIYPKPACPGQATYMLQLLPRGHDPVAVKVTHYAHTQIPSEKDAGENRNATQQQEDGEKSPEDEESNPDLFYGELRDGNSSTLFLPCDRADPERTPIGNHGVVTVEATGEILLHVLLRNDSYAVPPKNALGGAYTLLSIPHGPFNTTFVIVVPVSDCEVKITNTVGAVMSKQKTKTTDAFSFSTTSEVTGWRVSADPDTPLLVLVGTCSPGDPLNVMQIEHVRPEGTWGSKYVLPVPFKGKGFTIRLSAYANGAAEHVKVMAGKTLLSMNTNGNVEDLTDKIAQEGIPLVLEISTTTTKPFQLMCLMISPFYVNDAYRGSSRYGYSLRTLLTVPPVEQYLTDHCLYPEVNVKVKTTIVAGVQTQGSSVINGLGNGITLNLTKPWVRVFKDSSIRSIGIGLNRKGNADKYRMWFHGTTLLRRLNVLYYLHGGSYLTPLPSPCTNQVGQRNDRIDNDCDGFIDEELCNGVDDDGDGRIDEDCGGPSLRDCLRDLTGYLWEPNRYRITRFEANYYEFANRLPGGNERMVYISASVGVTLVFVFFFAIWIIDHMEHTKHPDRPPRIF